MRSWMTIFTILIALQTGNTAVAVAASTRTDRIVIAWEAPVRSLDPRFASDANSQYLEDLANCSLMSFGPTGATLPDLAAGPPQWTTPTTLSVKIKANAKFADGTLVTADDVKATYQFFLKTAAVATPSPRAGAFSKVTGIEKKSNDTVVFQLAEPDASFVTNLVVGILPAKLAQGPQIETPIGHVGCGPFKIVSADVTSLLLEKNPNYSLGAPPKVGAIEIKIVKDEKTRFAKLQKGEVDLVQNLLSRDVLKDVERKFPNLRVVRRPALKTSYLGFNMKDKVSGNLAVRKAIALALDRQEIIDYILAGLATPARSMLVPGDPFLNTQVGATAKDLAKAGKILDEAGFKPSGANKVRLQLSLKTTTDVTRVSVAKAIATQLKKVGIEVVVEPMEWGRFAADVEAGRIQTWTLSWIGFKDPDIYRYAFGTEALPPNGGNRGWYSNASLDKMLTEGRTTTDPAKRGLIYGKVQEVVAEDLPYVFLWHEENFAVHSSALAGFELYADGRYSSLTKASK